MEKALAALNSLAVSQDDESVKKRDAEIRSYLSAVHNIADASKAALLSNPMRAFEVRSVAGGRFLTWANGHR